MILHYLFACGGERRKVRRDKAPQEDKNPNGMTTFGDAGPAQATPGSSPQEMLPSKVQIHPKISRPTPTYSLSPKRPEVMHIQTSQDPGAIDVRGLTQEIPAGSNSVESSKIPPMQGFSMLRPMTPRKPRMSEFALEKYVDSRKAKLSWNDLMESEHSFFFF